MARQVQVQERPLDGPRWAAPTVTTAVDASVTLPGSKSLTNRYLVIAALATSRSRVRAPLRSRDTLLMASALTSLGARITDDGGGDWIVEPSPLRGGSRIDCGLAGTVMRFLPPIAAVVDGPTSFDGDAAARRRPMAPVLDALRQLGVRVDGGPTLPFTVHGAGSVTGGEVTIDAAGSSQFVSGLLLTGSATEKGIVVTHEGPPLPSLPHVAMTVQVLNEAGVRAESVGDTTWQVWPTAIEGLDVTVEPDLSNAAPFLAAAAATGGRMHVPGWPLRTNQAGDALRDILDTMGADVTLTGDGLTVAGGDLYGLEADLHDVGELTPVLAALAALADGPSHLYGVAHLRGHETDRLHALAVELNALGGEVTETDDGLRIRPRQLHGGPVATYGDHRIAMAAAVLGLRVPGVEVVDVATTGKTLPDFPGLWSTMLTSAA